MIRCLRGEGGSQAGACETHMGRSAGGGGGGACGSFRPYLHSMAAESTMAMGLATSCPAMSGAEPCTCPHHTPRITRLVQMALSAHHQSDRQHGWGITSGRLSNARLFFVARWNDIVEWQCKRLVGCKLEKVTERAGDSSLQLKEVGCTPPTQLECRAWPALPE